MSLNSKKTKNQSLNGKNYEFVTDFELPRKKGIYTGRMKDGAPHGKGRLVKDGSIFEGYFRHGEKSGHGKKVNPDGSWFEGEYKHNLPNGKGIHISSKGEKYMGDWRNGLFHGLGGMFY